MGWAEGVRQGMPELWGYHHPISSVKQSLCDFIYPGEIHPQKTQNNYTQKNFLCRFKSWKQTRYTSKGERINKSMTSQSRERPVSNTSNL